MKKRFNILAVANEYQLKNHFMLGYYNALAKRFNVTYWVVDTRGRFEDTTRIKDINIYHAMIISIRFKDLINYSKIRWNDFCGIKMQYDLDAVQNFIAHGRYYRKWEKVFKRLGFDYLLCTGLAATNKFNEQKIPTLWCPKALDTNSFHYNREVRRNGICFYGAGYPPRKEMLKFLSRKGFNYHYLKCSYGELNGKLNKFLGILICDYGLCDVMSKHFEASGTGCVPFRDYQADLTALGYEDGKHMVIYKNFEELYDKLQYFDSSDKLEEMGKNAAEFTLNNHSYDKRMDIIENAIKGLPQEAGGSLPSLRGKDCNI